MRILLVSQMYPGPVDPDLGVFVRGLEEQLVARGNDVERAVLDHRAGGKRRYLALARDTIAVARRSRAARRDGTRSGRRERGLDPGHPVGDATRCAASSSDRCRLGLPAPPV